MSNYVELSNLTKIYPTPKGEAVIVKDFNLNIQKGEFVTLIGHSGCGKSTVLSMLAGLNEITEGAIILAGKELSGAGPDRGVVFQSPKLLLLDEPFGMLDSLTRYELQQVLIELWRKNKITALMVTHDVDEALFLSDRIVCMTDGPAAAVGEILPVHFPRPRERKAVLEHPDYYELREHLIEFLEVRAHRRPVKTDTSTPVSPPRREEPLLNPT